tara:strand:- start:1024 stop:1215 length:192 start_codon:yes stop_codon:yes gene_type:complete
MECPKWSKDEGEYVFKQSQNSLLIDEMINDLDRIRTSKIQKQNVKDMAEKIQEDLEELRDSLK